jgi:hypothetical protein
MWGLPELNGGRELFSGWLDTVMFLTFRGTWRAKKGDAGRGPADKTSGIPAHHRNMDD